MPASLPVEQRVLTADEIGDTFVLAKRRPGKVDVNVGDGLYVNRSGQVCAIPYWWGTVGHRLVVGLFWVLAFLIGWIAARWVDRWPLAALVAVGLALAFLLGWWVSYWRPQVARRRR